MPFVLVAETFSQDKLPAVAAIDCGSDEWGKVANDWIKCVGTDTALSSMSAHGTEVLLYYDESDQSLVGFGSLGLTTRRVGGAVREFSVIPHIGVDARFHGFPRGEPWERRAGALIMRDLIYRAQSLNPDYLMLFVHEQNNRARKLYDRLGFICLGNVNAKGYQPMALQLR